MTGISVRPYWELTFDADGDVDTAQRDSLVAGLGTEKTTDLVVFSHGWNSDRSGATRLYSHFFKPFPGLLRGGTPGVRVGYVGVLWPSMRFSDEPIPDFGPAAVAAGVVPSTLDQATQAALAEVFPGREAVVRELADLLEERPDEDARFADYAELVRRLTGIDARAADAPAMLVDDSVAVCEVFAAALEETAAPAPGLLDDLRKRLWNGAHELLRQATYFAMKRRAGTVGANGLGPALGVLAAAHPGIRIHLVGHSFGGRLVSYALLGLPEGVRNVKSVTLLQGAFSHYAFAGQLPFDRAHGGALHDAQGRVDGPVVSCYSSHDSALGTMYPLASKLAGDSRSIFELGDRWGAMGHDGIQAVEPCERLLLAEALRGAFPGSGCVSVDASEVVRSGGPPSGAHSDICHDELARVVLRAGRLLG
ncbi:serine-threonine protein kinase [Streptomyces sp. NPDC059373]